jgi:hypothetical protein
MTPSGLLDLVAAIMLAVAAASVARLVAATPLLGGGPWRPLQVAADADVAHALMGIAMAGMFAPGLRTLPNAAWAVLFGLSTAWFACRAWLDAHGVRALLPERCTLHLVHCAAMLYTFLALGVAPAASATGTGGMGMGGAAIQTLQYPTLAGVFTLLLIGYSVWDLDQLSGRRYALASAGGPAGSAVVSVREPAARALLLAPGTKVSWEVILGVAMAVMLMIMI